MGLVLVEKGSTSETDAETTDDSMTEWYARVLRGSTVLISSSRLTQDHVCDYSLRFAEIEGFVCKLFNNPTQDSASLP